MPDTFPAMVIDRDDDTRRQSARLREMSHDDLMDGDVELRVTHTTMNYKDALALIGSSPVVRRFPMVPGIDLAGVVTASDNPGFKAGDEVILNGWGVGETHLGGYAGAARVRGDWLMHKPGAFSARDCMAIGTAGYTAALCVRRLLDHEMLRGDLPVLVTGASGGVGSFAVSLLAHLGFDVAAVTGKSDGSEYLRELGASDVLPRADFAEKGKPLGKERFAGAVDSVGSQTLASVLAQVRYDGIVAACGLAGGFDLPATVMPFILRGVTLAGIDSVYAPMSRRQAAWSLLADKLDRSALDQITTEAQLEDTPRLARDLLDGKVRGRLVIEVS